MQTSAVLASSGLPRNEAEVLLAHVLRSARSDLLAHPERELSREQAERFSELLARRRNGEPVAYLTGEKEFYGRPFFVTRDTLIPRPSTEGLVEAALRFLQHGRDQTTAIDNGIVACCRRFGPPDNIGTVADIGTGSGCIAVTMSLERSDLRVIGTDQSEEALRVARQNAARHDVSERIRWFRGDLLAPLAGEAEPFLIVSNPPYVPDGERLMRDIGEYEPASALRGGADGADTLRRLWREAWAHPFCRGIVVECRTEQVAALS